MASDGGVFHCDRDNGGGQEGDVRRRLVLLQLEITRSEFVTANVDDCGPCEFLSGFASVLMAFHVFGAEGRC
eukprot:scaffold1154_cov200-Cylindrotheca_fusiformis.AAC.3